MMRLIIFVFLFLHTCFCFSQKEKKDAVGKMNSSVFYNDKNYREWFLPEYNQYALQEVVVEEMRPTTEKMQFVIVMGTWCEDSHYEFPRLIKLMDALGVARKNLQIFAVNKTKTEPEEVISTYRVSKVPMLLMKKPEESEWQVVATEKPQISWEVDLLNTLKKDK
jgi:thiol-disulfide isomerase/thioredoxin